MTKNWSMTLAEHPSQWGIDQDVEKFGRAFSHPFIIIRNEEDEVVEEIHGRWQNTLRTRQFINLEEQYMAALEGRVFKLPLLHPMAVVSPSTLRDTHKAVSLQPFYNAPREEIERHIAALKINVKTVNGAKTPFYRYAVPGSGFGNCQSSLATAIVLTKDFPPVPDLTLAHTGWTGPVKTAIKHSS